MELFHGDITQKNSLPDICKDIDISINAAGIYGKWKLIVDELRRILISLKKQDTDFEFMVDNGFRDHTSGTTL